MSRLMRVRWAESGAASGDLESYAMDKAGHKFYTKDEYWIQYDMIHCRLKVSRHHGWVSFIYLFISFFPRYILSWGVVIVKKAMKNERKLKYHRF